MGVIKKILFRGNILGRSRHRNLFLDMEENIHIHYRDLRVEMGRGEFEEFVGTFTRQAAELQAIIDDKDYRDGKLPNANQEDVRIWTESRLKHDVKYHPQRFSLEECGDGYHFHYRNYKILIDADEFRQIAELFRRIELDGRYASTYDEVVELLEANDIDFVFDAGNAPGESLALSVAHYHLPKVKDVFRYIGFASSTEGAALRFSGERLSVTVRASKQHDPQYYRMRRSLDRPVRLLDHLSRRASTVDPDELNRIKCQVLDLYYAIRDGSTATVEIDPSLWLYAPEAGKVVFPYAAAPKTGKADAERMYRSWSGALARLQLGFVKPRKRPYRPAEQQALQDKVTEALRREVAAFAAVSKVYVMGSAIRNELGRYQAPFVHGKMVKLGSDIDILIEIDPAREADIPTAWRFVTAEASNHCAVYHVAEITMRDGLAGHAADHPNIPFVQHLIDAYVHFPSRGHHDEKDAFLRKFGARLFYDRARDGAVFRDELEARIAAAVTRSYTLEHVAVERMKVSSENAIFKVFSDGHAHILKLFKASGNYSSSRIAEHTAYEAQLVTELKRRGLPIAGIRESGAPQPPCIDGAPALLFERIPGEVQQRPEYPLAEIGASLAALHRTQLDAPLDLPESFRFDDMCMIWLPAFDRYLRQPWDDEAITEALARLAPIADRHHPGEHRAALFQRSPALHCHGDVTPKNVIVVDGMAWLFDFNNAFHGPRMADIIDGAFEFSLAEKYFHLADFSRFDRFIDAYAARTPLRQEETKDLQGWTELIGLIKFAKELRVVQQRPKNEKLRRNRAIAIADFVLARACEPVPVGA